MGLDVVGHALEGVLARRMKVVLDELVLIALDGQGMAAVLRHGHLDDVPGVLHDERRRRVAELEWRQFSRNRRGDVDRRLGGACQALLERLVDVAPVRRAEARVLGVVVPDRSLGQHGRFVAGFAAAAGEDE
jgi:hypothetical protein